MNRIRRIETWARLGYVARGLVYLQLGWIALSSGRALSTGETVQAVDDLPGGIPLLAALMVGLFGYGLFKIYAAILDLDHEGSDAKGRVVRAANGLAGLGYFALAFAAAKQLLGGAEGNAEEAAIEVASSGGDLLLIAIGLALLTVAAAQLRIAYRAKFMAEMPGAPRQVKPVGQIGYVARATVIAIVGFFFVKAGLDGTRVRGFGDALGLVRNNDEMLFNLIAGGLMLFGLVSLVMARYRRIEDGDMVAGLRSKMSGRQDET